MRLYHGLCEASVAAQLFETWSGGGGGGWDLNAAWDD